MGLIARKVKASDRFVDPDEKQVKGTNWIKSP